METSYKELQYCTQQQLINGLSNYGIDCVSLLKNEIIQAFIQHNISEILTDNSVHYLSYQNHIQTQTLPTNSFHIMDDTSISMDDTSNLTLELSQPTRSYNVFAQDLSFTNLKVLNNIYTKSITFLNNNKSVQHNFILITASDNDTLNLNTDLATIFIIQNSSNNNISLNINLTGSEDSLILFPTPDDVSTLKLIHNGTTYNPNNEHILYSFFNTFSKTHHLQNLNSNISHNTIHDFFDKPRNQIQHISNTSNTLTLNQITYKNFKIDLQNNITLNFTNSTINFDGNILFSNISTNIIYICFNYDTFTLFPKQSYFSTYTLIQNQTPILNFYNNSFQFTSNLFLMNIQTNSDESITCNISGPKFQLIIFFLLRYDEETACFFQSFNSSTINIQKSDWNNSSLVSNVSYQLKAEIYFESDIPFLSRKPQYITHHTDITFN